jgi:hypothetical protein
MIQQPYQPQWTPAPQPPSFTNKAVGTFLLYLLFWLPGLIVNVIYLREAIDLKKRMGGFKAPGYTALWVLFWLGMSPVFAVMLLFVSIAVLTIAGISFPSQF